MFVANHGYFEPFQPTLHATKLHISLEGLYYNATNSSPEPIYIDPVCVGGARMYAMMDHNLT